MSRRSILFISRTFVFAVLSSVAFAKLAFALDAPAREPVDLVVGGGWVLTVDARFTVIPEGAVAVREGKILAVAPLGEIDRRFQANERLVAPESILMPGLVNLHNHAAMTLLRGGADDRALMDWLTNFMFPAEARNVSPEFVRVGTQLACLEMIRSGTTLFADMYYFEEEVARAVDEAGLRAVAGETVIGFPVPDAPTPEKALERARAYIAKWKGHPRVIPAVAPHAPYTVAPDILRACEALSKESGTPLLIHLAETQDEEKQIRAKYGLSPVAHLGSLGLLSKRLVAAHCVWPSIEDIGILAKSGVSCVHNPESNMKLASGASPVTKMLAAGVPVGLGTDGPASNNNLDMFEAMDFAGKLAKLSTGDPSALPARAVIEMATRRGAEILGLANRIGSLEPGKEADLVLLRIDTPAATPLYDPASQVVSVLKGADVRAVWVAGKALYRDGKFLTLDEAAIRAKANELQKKVVASLAKPAAAAPATR